MGRGRSPTYHEQLRAIANKYIQAGEPWPATTLQIARWARTQQLWAPRPEAELRRFAEDLAEAMREEVYEDPQGRRVRTKHAARIDGKQSAFWDDIRTASRDHMKVSVSNRRNQIVGDSFQLKQDTDSFNENSNDGEPIRLVLDFTDDVAEMEALKKRRGS
ncbi:MAG: hypothetical protein NTZ05_19290 [Chloroflexi bacterium]|nr:hypothetical protein [Chloroflexota bacterium]